MVNFLGLLIAVSTSIYTCTYAWHVWRQERNPLGAAALGIIALFTVALPFYILYIRG